MGLDMYLYANKLFSSKYYGEEDEHKFNWCVALLGIKALIPEDDLRFARLSVQVAYWRKANHIHKFFVDHCCNGKDDCGYHPIYREDLKKLINLCKQVIENHELAETLLPTQSGFFFGSTEYDEWYYKDVETTYNTIKNILDNTDDSIDFEYHASW